MNYLKATIISMATLSPALLEAKYIPHNVEQHLAIQKTVNAFSFAVDARPVPTFENIFTEHAELNLTIPGSQHIGLQAINRYFTQLLPPYTTQHNFGTQKIDINDDCTSAVAITSFTGTFWSVEGELPTYAMYFQQYKDTLVKVDDKWLISKKTVAFMTPPLGNMTLG